MNVLYLAHRVPFPPDKGDKLRAFHQLEHLARKHRVWCACFVDDPADAAYASRLTEWCEEVMAIPLSRGRAKLRGLWGLATGQTVTESFYHCDAMKRALRRHWEAVKPDVVVAFSSSMAPYALQVPAARHVLDLCDLDSQKWLDYARRANPLARRLYRIEGNRLAVKERQWLEAFDATIVITAAEAAGIQGAAPPGKLHVVGNGVMLPSLVTEPEDADDLPADPPLPCVGFVGQMDYPPNVDAVCWFARDVWPAVWAACPQAVFRIVGRSPVRAVRKLAARPGVQVIGPVENVVREIQRFTVSVGPLRIARGLQNKVLEAMAAAKPVVLTTQAAEGIEGCDGHEFVIANDPRDMAAAVVRLLTDESAAWRIGQAAQRFVDKHHRWEAALRRFETIVTGAASAADSKKRDQPALECSLECPKEYDPQPMPSTAG